MDVRGLGVWRLKVAVAIQLGESGIRWCCYVIGWDDSGGWEWCR